MWALAVAFVVALLALSAPPAYAANSSKSSPKVPQGSLTVAADAYAVESPSSKADSAPEPAPDPEPAQAAPAEQTPEAPAPAAQPAQQAPEAPAAAESEPAAPAASPSAPAQPEFSEQSSSSNDQVSEPSDQPDETQSVAAADTSAEPSESSQETHENVSGASSALSTASDSSTPSTAGATENVGPSLKTQSNDDKGSISVLDPHEATITYSASDNGWVAQGTADEHGDKSKSVSEHHDNSLTANAVGATAIPDDGYHFVRWIDVMTGATVATSITFAPVRPDNGWPVSMNVAAVFARDMYVLILDPNGGTAGGGGGSSGVVTMEVTPGSNFQIPVNGSDTVSMTKAGSAFVGWNTVANPGKASSSDSYAIADGQILDAATESSLERLNFLGLDWSNENIPTLTLYAQWLVGQVAIKYKADDGGMIALNNGSSENASTIVSEIMDANTGVHAYDASSVGPSGASAIADARKHFAGWTVSGSTNKFDSDEATDADLSSDVVTRMTYYPNNTNMPSKYHAATFTASFAPNTYILEYEANGGTGSIDSTSLTYGSTVTTASTGLTRNGYKLTGWNLSADGSGTSVALGATLDSSSIDSMISSGVINDENAASAKLYAQWEYVGGEDPEPETDTNQTVTPTPTPTPIMLPDPEPATTPKTTSNTKTTTKQKTEEKTEKKTKAETKEDPEPEPVPDPVTPEEEEDNNKSSDTPTSRTSEPEYTAPAASSVAPTATPAATAATAAADAAKTPVEREKAGALASDKGKDGASGGPVVARESYNDFSASAANGNDDNVLNKLMTPEGMQTASTTVVAVAAVGAIAGLVGVGVSVAGAAMIGAATIGTASAIGLTTAADLAADLAASAAIGAVGAGASRRRKEEEEEGEDGLETPEQAS